MNNPHFHNGNISDPLLAQAKVDILDKAWAELHVGMFAFNNDIFRAELCFKGRVEYGLNILKVRQIRANKHIKRGTFQVYVTSFRNS